MKTPFEQGDGAAGAASSRVVSAQAVSIGVVLRCRLADYMELAKLRITGLVLFVTAVGFSLGSEGGIDLTLLANALIGTALVACGANALNQYLEREYDRLMRRTADRPLPAGRIAPAEALAFGCATAALGALVLALLVNLFAATLALATLALYLFAYTPLKRRVSMNTLVGAVPGAAPPLIGFAAAGNDLAPTAWLLFAIVFFWQMPHFFAIAWMYRDDYRRGGFRMLSVVDPSGGSTARQTVAYSIALFAVSLLPAFITGAGGIYLLGALVLGLLLLGMAMRLAVIRTVASARAMLLTSVAYLPLLLLMLLIDRLST